MKVFEANISVTVLLEAESQGEASAVISNMSLGEVAFEIEQGEMIGHVSEPVVATLAPELRRMRLLEIGNDGSYFDSHWSDLEDAADGEDEDELTAEAAEDAVSQVGPVPLPDSQDLAEMTGMSDRELLDSAMAFLGNLDLVRGFEGYLRETMESPVPGPEL